VVVVLVDVEEVVGTPVVVVVLVDVVVVGAAVVVVVVVGPRLGFVGAAVVVVEPQPPLCLWFVAPDAPVSAKELASSATPSDMTTAPARTWRRCAGDIRRK
jgi:hypothetical protein